ncbi:G-protein coupled receptor family C group 6 member A-like [Toxotes jaculatrix]|uniref:G-protein coupled receptor family C group 6 member A-like n=1 Tax=Toxotes jaculatrix TaxID=941984 RepID=UPI001B3AFFBC|nr:G-protein coupled receptor family C group 6 member A-like [Toxotes jaculatrix]
MFLLWLFVSIMSACGSSSGENRLLHAYSPGDIIVGGLLPIHLKTNRTTTPGPLSCSGYDLQTFLRSQVMIYAIGEINQQLPNFTIGYDIYDTCGDVSIAISAALQLLKNQSDPQSCLLPANIHSVLPEPQTKVVIGERYSEVSIAVARVVALSSVAQISYASTSELLSKKLKFPTFLRTISSDEYQTKAIADLVVKFYWKTVAIVGSDDEYGKYGSDRLVDNFRGMNICIEFIDILPGYFSQNNSQARKLLMNLVSNINKSSAEAIILFTRDTNADIIMTAAVQYKLNRTWIASDTWSTSTKLSAKHGIELAGQVFGFISKRNEVPGFKDYVMSMFNRTTNAFLEDYLTRYPLCSNHSEKRGYNCTLPDSQESSNQCLEPSCLAEQIDQDESYNIYLAVQVIAEGIKRLLCDNQQCNRRSGFTALELFTEIRKVNFTVNTTNVFFDTNGDPSLGYDILHWQMNESTRHTHIITIGEYRPNEEIQVPEDLVKNMNNVNVTVYNCSKTCKPGQELKQQGHQCCKMCVPCANEEFSTNDGEECKRCGQDEYSSPQRDKCFQKTDEFLKWKDPFAIILACFGILGIIVTFVFAVLFIIYRSTPIVKAVGGYLCFLELFALLFCFCLTCNFIGKPTKASCMVDLPFFGIAFSLCISCILANLLQISVGFSFNLKISSWIKKLNQPLAVVTVVSAIQLALCVPWLYYYPPFPQKKPENETILHLCENGSTAFFGAMLGYNAFLAFICFLFAFKGRQLPDLYKNASLVAVSMLLFVIIWILFIPIYLNMYGKYKLAIECAAILISSYSILTCHLAPKCYIMVFRKELNNENAITEYIKKHYEQKGLAVVKS